MINGIESAEAKHITGKKPKEDDLSQLIGNYQSKNQSEVWNQIDSQISYNKFVSNSRNGMEMIADNFKADNYKYTNQKTGSRLTHFFDSKSKYLPLNLDCKSL